MFWYLNRSVCDSPDRRSYFPLFSTASVPRYSSAADELLTTVRKTEDSLKRLKKQFKRPGAAAATGEEGTSDEDKIRMQILLDVKQFGQEISSLGVEIEGTASYAHLVSVTSELANEA